MSEIMKGPSNPMLGRKHTEEELAWYRERFAGEGNPRYGVHLSDETKAKISKAKIGSKMPPEHGRKISRSLKQAWAEGKRHRPDNSGKPKKRVLCVEEQREFESIADAMRWLDKDPHNKSNLIKALKDNKYTYCGYHWKYL